jgi:uncharacterized protein (TIGR02246 family)
MHRQCVKFSSLVVLAAIVAAPLPAQTRNQQSPSYRTAVDSQFRTLQDREQIRQLLIDYGRTLDSRDFEAFSKLYADDAEYSGGAGTAIKGPAAIAKSLEDTFKKNPTGVRTPNFHVFANEVIQVNGDEATAISKGLFVVPNASNTWQIEMIASYEDLLVRTPSGWKFKKRVVHAEIPAAPARK